MQMTMSSPRPVARRLDGRRSRLVGLGAGRRLAGQGTASNRLCRSRRIRPMPIATFRRGRSSATRICIPRFPWMRARSARGSAPTRRLPLRPGRAGDLLHRPAGEALPSARLPRGRRSLRQHGLLSGPVRGQARAARRPDRPQMVRHDPVRQGRGGRDRDHRRLLARDVPEGPHVLSRARAPIAARGRRRLPPRSNTTSRAASPPSSATSGPRTPAATTCIATSSSATTATRRARSSRSPSIRRTAATIRSSCGNGWRPTKRRPAAACWPSRITAI